MIKLQKAGRSILWVWSSTFSRRKRLM